MTNLLIVGKLPEKVYLNCVNGYRGVQRIEIQYPIEFYKTGHPIETINEKYEKLTKSDPFLHDIIFARKLRDIYNEVYPHEEREIIEIVFDNYEPLHGKILLGFDIADFGYSNILNIILTSCERKRKNKILGEMNIFLNNILKGWERKNKFLVELNVICNDLKMSLNKNELFNTMDDAKNAQIKIEDQLTKQNRMAKHHKYYSVGIWVAE